MSLVTHATGRMGARCLAALPDAGESNELEFSGSRKNIPFTYFARGKNSSSSRTAFRGRFDGFVPYGVERQALLINGPFDDDELLALDLRKDRPAVAQVKK